jgi:iron complex outermembrane receptor protein
MLRHIFCAAALAAAPTSAFAQSNATPVELPPVNVEGTAGSLTVPDTDQAREIIERTPGSVEIVPDSTWRDRPANALKDVLDYTPGIFAQTKWGEDTRLSIRGSGLSRNYHLRGIQMYQDGIPMNASDGSADFQEIDPTAFRYLEVYKGANGLRYGANTLGGALNFVSPTGYDADLFSGRADIGSFGFGRLQASAGGNDGTFDAFVTGAWLTQDGFRDHSAGESNRGSGNLGWRISDNLETRFYLSLTDIQQEIPGSVTKAMALNDPRRAATANLVQNYQRNIESQRFANKTTLTLDNTTVEFGGYAIDKHLVHPIFQFLDYEYHDFGGFARVTTDGNIAGHDNRLTIGATYFGGWIDNSQYQNLAGGRKGSLLSQSTDRSRNYILYGENAFKLRPDLSLIAGLQYVYATRERIDLFDATPDTSGSASYHQANPKLGLLWQVDPGWQAFANISRSSEIPSFGELNFTNAALSDTEPQKAVTFEIGTRGRRDTFNWDLSAYRSQIRDEFLFVDLGGGNYQVTNADRTVHQGIEAGFGWSIWDSLFKTGAAPDRVWLNTAYTFSDFHFDGDSDWGDNDLPGAPHHYLRAELLYKHPNGFYAGPNIEWVPQAYFVDNANTLDTEPYALLGFRMGYEFNDHVSMFIEARNLTDERYISSVSTTAVADVNAALFEPGTGRAFFAGLQARW